MAERKRSDTDRRLLTLAGASKLRALLSDEGVLNKHIAIAAGVYAPDITLWLQGRQEIPAATAFVAEKLRISEDEVERLRRDQRVAIAPEVVS